MTSIMSHQLDLTQKRRAVEELYRILKPGGRYVSGEFGPKADTRLKRRMAKGEWTLYPYHLLDVGFKITRVQLARAMWGKRVVYRVAQKGNGPGLDRMSPGDCEPGSA